MMITVIKKGSSIEEINEKLKSISSKPNNQIKKYAGILKLKSDPLKWQKKMRNKWE